MFRTYVAGLLPAAASVTVHGIRTAWLLIVMPRSRSMSIRSRYWARALRSSTTPVSCSMRSASVDLPWSMWAMMQKLRMMAGSVRPGGGACGGAIGWLATYCSRRKDLGSGPGHPPTEPWLRTKRRHQREPVLVCRHEADEWGRRGVLVRRDAGLAHAH